LILLDTNVISELMRPIPSPRVLKWIDQQDKNEIGTCAIVVAEILSGLDLMPAGKRKTLLQEKTAFMLTHLFADRILDFDLIAANSFGIVLHAARSAGRPLDGMDGLIAAIVLANHCTLATRDVDDFKASGVPLINPWD
jgi:toxin FitB